MNPYLLNNYSVALSIKSSIQYRFRKFDHILTNIQNEIYMLNFLKLDSKMTKKIQHLCGQYINVLILNDHEKLRLILTMDYTKNHSLFEHKVEKESAKGRKVSKKTYKPGNKMKSESFEEEENENKGKSVSTLSRAFRIFMMGNDPQTLMIKSQALAVAGEFGASIKILSELMSSKKSRQHLSTFLPIYIFYANESYHSIDSSKYCSSHLKQFVKSVLCKTNKQIQPQAIPYFLSPQDSEYLLNSILSYLQDEPLQWTDLSFNQLGAFSHSVYLIAENYYLNNEKQKAIKMINELKNKLMKRGEISLVEQTLPKQQMRTGRRLATKKPSIQQPPSPKQSSPYQDTSKYQQEKSQSQLQSSLIHLITFFQFMHSYDSKSYSSITSQQSSFSSHQKQHFYQWYSVKNDILRSNIYQILSETFTKLNIQDKSDEYASLKVANFCVNDTYEINDFQETISEEETKVVQFLKKKKEAYERRRKGVPPHYLPIVSPFLVNF